MRSIRTRGSHGTKRGVTTDSSSSTIDHIYKDGRRIQVGDCVLFKSSQESPHFIGLIRWLSSNKDENINICVNKLYRPIELKLGKCILPDTVPNEVFYSFHRHEIPATSLLHPCKVAFLPKEVDLPSGRSSFVCRRVFDSGSKRLQWLTDKDYVDERQEEVDQLLYKTRMEMHASIPSGGPSPQAINGPTSKSQLKSGSGNVQTAFSIPSQTKGKKRDREDQDSEPIKRVRSLKADNPDSVQYRSESILKLEISKITEKGGLVDSVGVERLVQLMQPDRVEKKLELVSRSMFAGVLAATENFDCLSQFVQLKGLLVVDQWLQNIHKGKKGFECSPKDVDDKSTEEFLFILLRALEKLPVNLEALQMCNVGKSVNHLRNYRNSEIQKKARSLVDTWKKRVEAEINVNGTKSGPNQAVSWTSKSRLPKSSHGGNRQYGGPSKPAMKSSAQCSADKIASNKLLHAEKSAKLGSSSPGPTQVVPSPVLGKDGQPRSVVGSNPDLPPTTARDERSSRSSQSQNNSQSSSSGHAKTPGFSGKEDARSSTAGSISGHKVSSGGSQPWRSINGHPGSAAPPGSPREAGFTKNSSLHNNLAPEKLSHSALTCEKKLDPPTIEGSSKKLIVKISCRGRSLKSANVGPVEEPTVTHCRATSQVLSEKNDQSDSDSKKSADLKATYDVKTESWQSNDFKDILTGSDEGDGSPVANPDGYGRDDDANLAENSIDVSHSLENGMKLEKLYDASYSSMNALVESCVNTSISGGDDGGMNLLASVAGEISKSTLPSPDGSPRRTSNIGGDEAGIVDENRGRAPDENDLVKVQHQYADVLHDSKEQRSLISVIHQQSEGKNAPASSDSKPALNLAPQINDRSDEVKNVVIFSACSAGKPLIADGSKHMDRNETENEAAKLKDRSVLVNGKIDDVSMCLKADSEDKADVREANKVCSYTYRKPYIKVKADERKGFKSPIEEFPLISADKLEGVKSEDKEIKDRVGKPSTGQGASNASCNEDHDDRMTCDVTDGSRESADKLEGVKSEDKEIEDRVGKPSTGQGASNASCNEDHDDRMTCDVTDGSRESADKLEGVKSEDKEIKDRVGKPSTGQGASNASCNEDHDDRMTCDVTDGSRECADKLEGVKSEDKEIEDRVRKPSTGQGASNASCNENHADRMTCDVTDGSRESESSATNAAVETFYTNKKQKFDLNEGFSPDAEKIGDPSSLENPGFSCTVNPLPLPVAAAKGPFIPPVDLLRSKRELGWKGSATTSAFRPAEPRKASPPDSSVGKPKRPVLDFDLNVADESIVEDLAFRHSADETTSTSSYATIVDFSPKKSLVPPPSVGRDLDLNRVDEAGDMWQGSASNASALDVPLFPSKSSSLAGCPISQLNRGFDLNSFPIVDEAVGPSSDDQHSRTDMQSQPLFPGLRTSTKETGTLSSLVAARNAFPPVTISSTLSDKGGDQTITANVPSTVPVSLPSELYRGSMLSSPAGPYPSFQYPVFPIGTGYPLSSASFSVMSAAYTDPLANGRLGSAASNAQVLSGLPPAVTSHFPRPIVLYLPDGGNSMNVGNSSIWGKKGLDLNAGPETLEMVGMGESSPLISRQLSVARSQAFSNEQGRLFPGVASSILKRSEITDNFRHKQPSWQ